VIGYQKYAKNTRSLCQIYMELFLGWNDRRISLICGRLLVELATEVARTPGVFARYTWSYSWVGTIGVFLNLSIITEGPFPQVERFI
jgi:hypothetical protein